MSMHPENKIAWGIVGIYALCVAVILIATGAFFTQELSDHSTSTYMCYDKGTVPK